MNTEFINAQSKADAVAKAFGGSAPAPLVGESLSGYRTRLLEPFLQHSKTFKNANVAKIGDPSAFAAVEDSIFADAMSEATHPTSFRPGELRAIRTADPSGRVITKYRGDPNACWDQFNPPIRYARRFMTPAR